MTHFLFCWNQRSLVNMQRSVGARSSTGDQDMWRGEKAKGACSYPKRQVIMQGGVKEVCKKFIQWPESLAWKAEWEKMTVSSLTLGILPSSGQDAAACN